MIHLAWTVMVPKGAPDLLDVLQKTRTGICEAFNLCTSEGCKCKVGTGKKVCYEEEAGKSSPVFISEGPSWTVNILSLTDRVEIHLYYGGPLVGREITEFTQLLNSFNYPVFQITAASV